MSSRAVPEVVGQRYDAAVPLSKLTPHPANPNVGDIDLLAELLTANGFAGAVLAQESTGVIVDDTRDRLLASINESVRRGHNDEAKLIALLRPFADSPGQLAGTAFTAERLAALVRHHAAVTADPNDPDSEWQNMPEFQQGDKTGAYACHVHFATDADADAFFELIGKPRTRVIWWPEPDGHKGDPLSMRVVNQ